MSTSSLLHTGFGVTPASRILPPWLSRLAIVPQALLVTLALLFCMQALVHQPVSEEAVEPTPVIPNVIGELPKIEEFLTREEPLVRPQEIELPPPLVAVEPVFERGESGIHIAPVAPPSGGREIDIDLLAGAKPMPIVRINPTYPASALSRGTEGYVDVVFDITPMGTTANIRILAYEPSRVFNAAVLKAVRGWKYRPSAQANQAGEAANLNVRERITFAIEQ